MSRQPQEKLAKTLFCIRCLDYSFVLGLARTGLISTGIQEGAQPGGLTQPQPGQTDQGIPYHVPSCWVPGGPGGGGATGTHSGSGGHSGGAVRESGSVLRVCSV